MGFFVLPDPPDPDVVVDDDVVRTTPWIGTAIAFNEVAAQSDDAAVVVSGIVMHQHSFEIRINSHLRNPGAHDHFFGPRPWHMADDGFSDRHLRIGLLWADGGRATNIDMWGHPWPDATEPAHWLHEGSGGGGPDSYEQQFHAGPIPTPDGLQLVVQWPAYGIDDTYVDLPAREMAAGATLARPVWPEDAHLPPSQGSAYGMHGSHTTMVSFGTTDEDAPDP